MARGITEEERKETLDYLARVPDMLGRCVRARLLTLGEAMTLNAGLADLRVRLLRQDQRQDRKR